MKLDFKDYPIQFSSSVKVLFSCCEQIFLKANIKREAKHQKPWAWWEACTT